jgi:hypothetical protein
MERSATVRTNSRELMNTALGQKGAVYGCAEVLNAARVGLGEVAVHLDAPLR